MGLDIFGYIECQVPNWGRDEPAVQWVPAMDLRMLTDTRDYDAFGCLFGVRNHANFRPVTGRRRVPHDLSVEVRAKSAGAQVYSWVSWVEIKEVDWDEPALASDDRVHEYRRLDDGSLEYIRKASWTAEFEQGSGVSLEEVIHDPPVWEPGREWVDGDRVFRVELLRRRHAIPPTSEWRGVFTVMRTLAARYGDDCVRLVVWFD